MIERLEVTHGAGTVIRFGGIVAWADAAASPALISFLAQSARNLAPSPRGGRQIADHIAGVLTTRDPEPQVGFAVIGPSDHGWATLLHGPAQAWDGAKWLAPARTPGWVQAIITARPTVTVGPAGAPLPPVQPDSMLDLEAGVVPGTGFVLVPAVRAVRVGAVAAGPGRESLAGADDARSDLTPPEPATEILAASGAVAMTRPGPEAAEANQERTLEGSAMPAGGPGSASGEAGAAGGGAGAAGGEAGAAGGGLGAAGGGLGAAGAGLLAAGAAAEVARREADHRDADHREMGQDAAAETEPTTVQRAVEGVDEPLTVQMGAIDPDAARLESEAATGESGLESDDTTVAALAAAGSAGREAPAADAEPATKWAPRRRLRRDRSAPPGSVDLQSVLAPPRPPLPHPGGADQRIPGLPLVAGVLCSQGHLNRTGLRSCVKCGRTIDANAAEASGTRPPLGVIVTDDGTVYRIDQGYVVGSSPDRDPTVSGGLARPLLLPGEDVSSTHAEIRLQEWDAMILDRGSAAGTNVFEPGAQAWDRCAPFEPRVLPPGSHVAFGQRIVTFLGPWRRSEEGRSGQSLPPR